MSKLSSQQESLLREHTSYWLVQSSRITGENLPEVPVLLDLKGSAAGQYRGGAQPCIRYNRIIAAQAFEDFIARTIPHEVAHYVVDRLYAGKRVKPHGIEWQSMMRAFGLEPSVCHRYDLSQVPVRQQRRYDYICNCREHRLSATRHNRVQHKGINYLCSQCGSELRAVLG
jgi:SprT protein